MFHSTTFDRSTRLPVAAEAALGRLIVGDGDGRSAIAIEKLAFEMLVAFRAHPHINNVLTHVSGGDWGKIEQALRTLFDVSAPRGVRAPIETNLLDLMCAERGVAGRIMKPYVHEVLNRIVGPHAAWPLIRRLTALCNSLEAQSRC